MFYIFTQQLIKNCTSKIKLKSNKVLAKVNWSNNLTILRETYKLWNENYKTTMYIQNAHHDS